MAYVRMSEAKAVGKAFSGSLQKRAGLILTEDSRGFSTGNSYDIFLSHSYGDGEIILGVKRLIEGLGLSVYVDWIEDPNLDHGKVTSRTAAILRLRMRACSALIYVHSSQSAKSVWMPWEIGFFDGFKPSHVWILPVVANSDSEFENQEYLGLYPTVEQLTSPRGQYLLAARVGSDQLLLPTAVRRAGS
jgi:hypothetical protein